MTAPDYIVYSKSLSRHSQCPQGLPGETVSRGGRHSLEHGKGLQPQDILTVSSVAIISCTFYSVVLLYRHGLEYSHSIQAKLQVHLLLVATVMFITKAKVAATLYHLDCTFFTKQFRWQTKIIAPALSSSLHHLLRLFPAWRKFSLGNVNKRVGTAVRGGRRICLPRSL